MTREHDQHRPCVTSGGHRLVERARSHPWTALRTAFARVAFICLASTCLAFTCVDVTSAASANFEDIKVVAARPPLDIPPTATATLGLGRFVSSIASSDEVFEATSGPFCSDAKRLVWSQASQVVINTTADWP